MSRDYKYYIIIWSYSETISEKACSNDLTLDEFSAYFNFEHSVGDKLSLHAPKRAVTSERIVNN
jgi:hypothetical protein